PRATPAALAALSPSSAASGSTPQCPFPDRRPDFLRSRAAPALRAPPSLPQDLHPTPTFRLTSPGATADSSPVRCGSPAPSTLSSLLSPPATPFGPGTQPLPASHLHFRAVCRSRASSFRSRQDRRQIAAATVRS